MAVKKITTEKITQLEKKTVKTLPDDPSKQGYSPDQIKKRMYAALLDPDNSVIAEVNRIVDEINAALTEMGEAVDSNVKLKIYADIASADAAQPEAGTSAFIVSGSITI